MCSMMASFLSKGSPHVKTVLHDPVQPIIAHAEQCQTACRWHLSTQKEPFSPLLSLLSSHKKNLDWPNPEPRHARMPEPLKNRRIWEHLVMSIDIYKENCTMMEKQTRAQFSHKDQATKASCLARDIAHRIFRKFSSSVTSCRNFEKQILLWHLQVWRLTSLWTLDGLGPFSACLRSPTSPRGKKLHIMIMLSSIMKAYESNQ